MHSDKKRAGKISTSPLNVIVFNRPSSNALKDCLGFRQIQPEVPLVVVVVVVVVVFVVVVVVVFVVVVVVFVVVVIIIISSSDRQRKRKNLAYMLSLNDCCSVELKSLISLKLN